MSETDYHEAIAHVDLAADKLQQLAKNGANHELIEAAQLALEIARESLETVIASLPAHDRDRILSLPHKPSNN